MNTNQTVTPNGLRIVPTPTSPLTILPAASDTRARVMRTGDPKRDAILSDATIHDAIRRVIRKRGIREQDVQDVLHEVLEAACDDDGLPLDDKEHARNYLAGCARYRSIDRVRSSKRQEGRHSDVEPDLLVAPGISAEDSTLAREILAHGRKTFPFTHAWFERFVMGDETHAEIAADPRVTAGHVANEVSKIRASLRAFALAGLAVLLSVFALRAWRLPWAHHAGDNIAKKEAPAPKPSAAPSVAPSLPTPPAEAVALRERAEKECDAGHWNECLGYLDQASAIDPNGETHEMRVLRNRARIQLEMFEAKPRR
jgi:DNA-directed RNA polymerase specialized sigma24 family protein